MLEANPIFALLSRALDTAALRQAVHSANIANADVPDFHRLEVSLDPAGEPASAAAADVLPADFDARMDDLDAADDLEGMPHVISTNDSVRLDQEMALMAKDALRYEALLGAFERTTGLLDLAIREGKGV
ncbi:MAG TPA: flagellar basal body protein [Steroidobacteraceae bacterium]